MKSVKRWGMLYALLGMTFIAACENNNDNTVVEEFPEFRDTSLASIAEVASPNLTIRQGLVSQSEQTVRVLRNGEAVAVVRLGEPVIVAQADQAWEWGYFQFPKIYRAEDGNFLVRFQLKTDSYKEYGSDSYGWLASKNDGATWDVPERQYYHRVNNFVEFKEGNILQVVWRDSKDTKNYENFPSPVNVEPIGDRWFYKESELPDELGGVFFEYWNKQTGETTQIHGKLDDPGLLRYSYSADNLMPIVWNGNIREMSDGSIVAGVYPCYYQNADGQVLHSAISFFKSTDKGYNWKRIGSIPYQTDADKAPETYVYDGSEGFSEPTFVMLDDNTFVCVMRTGFYTPMYKSVSNDGGQHWTVPEAFTSNGVAPNLLHLGNDVIALSSGRPGVQLRFNIEGDGNTWTEPIEMLPFMDENGNYGNRIRLWPTCGYTGMLAVDDHTFYLVWSDFKRKNGAGEERKTILVRKIEVIKR